MYYIGIIAVSVIISRQIAFNKHVLKDYLATSVGTIKSESSRVYSTDI